MIKSCNSKNILKYFISLCLIFVISASANQTEEEKIKEMMIKKSEVFFSILNNKEYDKQTRKQKILDEIEPLFDFRLMSRLALNRKTWKSLSKEQRSLFSEVFISRVQKSYLSKLDVFKDVEVIVKDSIRVKKNRIEITALLKTNTDTKKLVYKFYRTKTNKWLIYDISVVGVSFLQSYRSQYASFLKTHSFEELMETFRRIDEKNSEQ